MWVFLLILAFLSTSDLKLCMISRRVSNDEANYVEKEKRELRTSSICFLGCWELKSTVMVWCLTTIFAEAISLLKWLNFSFRGLEDWTFYFYSISWPFNRGVLIKPQEFSDIFIVIDVIILATFPKMKMFYWRNTLD